MSREKLITKKLSVLKPQYLKVINDSHVHHGHESSPDTGDSHYTVEITAHSISDKTLIEQHKIINSLLKEEFSNGLHALSIRIIGKRK